MLSSTFFPKKPEEKEKIMKLSIKSLTISGALFACLYNVFAD